MSLGIIVRAPEGLVLAAESRVTLMGNPPVTFDHATKLLSFSAPNDKIGAVTYGQAAIGLRTAQSYLPGFEAQIGGALLSVADFAAKLSDFFMNQWHVSMPMPYTGANMEFNVAGFNPGEPYGRVYSFGIPNRPQCNEVYAADVFGIVWGGQTEFVDRLVKGADRRVAEFVANDADLSDLQKQTLLALLQGLEMQIPIAAMPLQDCVYLAIFLIRTTIAGQRLAMGMRGCGGFIDVATITRTTGLHFVQRKELRGELEIR